MTVGSKAKLAATLANDHRKLIGMAVVVLAAAIGYVVFRNQGLTSNESTAVVRRGSIIESVYGIGTVRATRSYELKTGVGTTIDALYVKEGDAVKRGQRLARLSEVGTFTAPFAGTVTSLPQTVGETVFPQAVLLQLVDLQDRYLTVSVEQRGALRVRSGQRARISVEGMRERYYEGIVQSVYSQENEFLVRIGISNLPEQVLPGMTADVAIGISEHADALLVPVNAVSEGNVYVARERGRVEALPVQTGVVDAEMAEIVKGDIQEGDRLVIQGQTGS